MDELATSGLNILYVSVTLCILSFAAVSNLQQSVISFIVIYFSFYSALIHCYIDICIVNILLLMVQ